MLGIASPEEVDQKSSSKLLERIWSYRAFIVTTHPWSKASWAVSISPGLLDLSVPRWRTTRSWRRSARELTAKFTKRGTRKRGAWWLSRKRGWIWRKRACPAQRCVKSPSCRCSLKVSTLWGRPPCKALWRAELIRVMRPRELLSVMIWDCITKSRSKCRMFCGGSHLNNHMWVRSGWDNKE